MSSFEEGQTIGESFTPPVEVPEETPVLTQQEEQPQTEEGISRVRAASGRGRKRSTARKTGTRKAGTRKAASKRKTTSRSRSTGGTRRRSTTAKSGTRRKSTTARKKTTGTR